MKKVVSDITIEIPFQRTKFFVTVMVSFAFSAIAYAAIYINITKMIGIIMFGTIYFMPTFVAFDLLNSYNADYKIEKLKHPNRHLIFWLNLLLGSTIVGWLVTLTLAYKPGLTQTQRVDYFE